MTYVKGQERPQKKGQEAAEAKDKMLTFSTLQFSKETASLLTTLTFLLMALIPPTREKCDIYSLYTGGRVQQRHCQNAPTYELASQQLRN